MVVLLPVGGDRREEVDEPRLHELFVPLLAQERLRPLELAEWGVVVDVVAGADEERRLEGEDRGEPGVAQRPVLGRSGARAVAVEERVVHAGDHHEAHLLRRIRAGQGAERAGRTPPGVVGGGAVLEAVEVAGARAQSVDGGLHDVVPLGHRVEPRRRSRVGEIVREGQLEPRRPRRPRHVAVDQAVLGGQPRLQDDAVRGHLAGHLALAVRDGDGVGGRTAATGQHRQTDQQRRCLRHRRSSRAAAGASYGVRRPYRSRALRISDQHPTRSGRRMPCGSALDQGVRGERPRCIDRRCILPDCVVLRRLALCSAVRMSSMLPRHVLSHGRPAARWRPRRSPCNTGFHHGLLERPEPRRGACRVAARAQNGSRSMR